ncbi:hypothetical protein [Synechococcus sp. CCY 0621]|nr:hypothetical protein [Synechococcus sp. CCY 0621]
MDLARLESLLPPQWQQWIQERGKCLLRHPTILAGCNRMIL